MSKATSQKNIIELLNEVLTAELTAINQYFLHGELCKHWGYGKLYSFIRRQSIDEMKHAEVLIERVLFIGGIPNVQRLGKVNIGETVFEQFKSDLALEQEAMPRLQQGIELCREAGDHGSRMLLEQIYKSEEEHIDWLQTQMELVKQIGEKNYLTQQMTPAA